jgi:hypothetical protein
VMRRTRAWTLGGLAVLAMVAMACGGDDGEEDGATTSSSGTKTTATATVAATKASGTGTAASGSSDFSDLFGELEDATYRAEYNVTGAGLGGSTMVWFRKDGKLRFDLTSAEGTFTIIDAGAQSVTCTSAGGSGTCFAAGAVGGLEAPGISVLEDFEASAANYQVEPIDDRTIAGISGECFRYSSASGTGTTCIGPNGELLLMEATQAGQTFSFTATSVDDDVSDADFVPPYPITELPQLPGFPPGGVPNLPKS